MTERASGLRRNVATFWLRGYQDNIVELAAMLSYYLLLSILPLALLALYIAGRVLVSAPLEDQVLNDLSTVFPATARSTLAGLLDQIRASSTGFGIVALIASIWLGSAFWSGLDTAFCRIYHVPCRSWARQKGFAVAMLVVVLLFILATIAVPTLQSLLVAGRRDLPFGLGDVELLVFAASLAISIAIIFTILCAIYWTVPNRRVPWRAVWPGALGATLAISIIDYGFPVYLSTISTLADVGTTLVFILIVLIWFFLVSLVILSGAVINAIRFELHETGELSAKG